MAYLEPLSRHVRVLVLDGSGDELYSSHERAFPPGVFRCRTKHPGCRNGKVEGVLTGVDVGAAARHCRRRRPLEVADVVRPQNYFSSTSPLPWHARWDTGCADYPGALAMRTEVLRQAGGYSGDVLFENLELLCTARAAGGGEMRADDLFVARLPSSTALFFRQRGRQAYDDFAQPLRRLPGCRCFRRAVLECPQAPAPGGRRRDRGRQVFGPLSAPWAPLWLVERALCFWLAMYRRLRGGIPYSTARLKTAAHSVRRGFGVGFGALWGSREGFRLRALKPGGLTAGQVSACECTLGFVGTNRRAPKPGNLAAG